MSTTVDERVVEMRFDNKEFDKNIGTTIDNLEKLKESLKLEDTSKNIDAVSRSLDKLDFSKLNRAADMISKKFSTIGTIMDQVVRRLTDKGMDSFSGVLNKILSGGQRRAENMANAEFTLKGFLKNDTDGSQLKEIMDSVSESVNGTAYSMDAAAKVAAQLIPTGIKGGEQLLGVLQGVAGTAAMTNSSFEDIGHIFTTVAAKGRLMGDQINQFSYRGLNVLETLGSQLGKTGAEVSKMVSKGQIDFMTFATAMENAFGAHAYKANETYSGSLANLNSALSRIGQPIQAARMEAMKGIFNATRVLVNDINTALKPMTETISMGIKLGGTMAQSILENPLFKEATVKIVTGLSQILGDIAVIIMHIAKGIKEAIPASALQHLSNFGDHLINLSRALLVNEETGKKIQKLFTGIFKIIKALVKIAWSFVKALKPVFIILGQILGVVLDLLSYFGDFLSAVADATVDLDIFAKALRVVLDILRVVASFIIVGVAAAFLTLSKIFAKIGNVIATTYNKIKNFGGEILAIATESKSAGEAVTKIIDLIMSKVTNMFSGGGLFGVIFARIAAMFGRLGSFFGGGFDLLKKFISFLFTGRGVLLLFAAAVGVLIKTLFSIKGTFVGLVKDTRSFIRAMTASFAMNNFLKLSISIGILATSISLLAMAMDKITVQKFFLVSFGIMALAAALYALSAIKQKGGAKKKSPLEAVALISSIALTIAAFSHLLKTMDGIGDFGSAVAKLGIVALIITALVGINVLLGGIKAENNNAATYGVLALCASTLLIVESLEKLSKFSAKKIKASSVILLAIIGVIGVISVILGRTGFANKSVVRNALVMALSMLTVSYTIKTLTTIINNIDYKNLKSGLKCLKGTEKTLTAFGILMVGIGIAAHGLVPLVASVGKAILSIAISTVFMTFATKMLINSIKEAPAETAVAMLAISAMAGLMALIAGYSTSMVTTGVKDRDAKAVKESLGALSKIISTIAVMSMLMIGEIAILAAFGPEWYSYIAPYLLMVAAIISIGIAIGQLKDLKVKKETVDALKTIQKMMLTMVGLIGVFVLLDAVDAGTMVGLVGAALATLLIMLPIIEIIKDLDDLKVSKGAVNALKIIKDIILMLAITLGALTVFTTFAGFSGVLVAAGSIALVMVTLIEIVKSIKELDGLKINKNTLATLKTLNLVILGLSGILVAFSYINNAVSTGVAVLGVSLLIMQVVKVVESIKELDGLKINKNTVTTVKILGLIIASLGVVMSVMSAVGGDWLKTVSVALAMLEAMKALPPIIESISKINDLSINKNTIKTIGMVGLVIVALGAAMTAMSAFGKNSLTVLASGGAIWLALHNLSGIIESISEIDDLDINKNTIKTVGMIGLVIVALGASMTAISAFGKNFASILASGAAMAMTMGVLIPVIKSIAELEDLKIDKSTISTFKMLAIILGALGGVMTVMSAFGKNFASILAAGAAMSMVMGVLIPIIRSISTLKNLTINKNTITTLIVLGSCVAAIGVVMSIMAGVGKNFSTILAAGAAMAGLTAVFIPIIANMTKLQNAKVNKSVITTLIVLGSCVSVMGLVTAALAAIGKDVGTILASAASLVILLGSLSLAVWALAKIPASPINAGVLVNIGALTLAMVFIADALEPLQNGDPASMIAAAGSMSLVLLAVSGCIALLSNFAANIAGAIVGAISVAIVMFSLLPMMNTLSQLANLDLESIKTAVLSMIGILAAVGIILGLLALLGSTGVGTLGLVVAAAAIVAIALGLSVLAVSISALVNSIAALATSVLEPLNQFILLSGQLPAAVDLFTAAVQTMSQTTSTYFSETVENFKQFTDGISAELDKALNEIPNKMAQLGQYAAQGYSNGLVAGSTGVSTASTAMIFSGINAAANAQQSHSPSEIFKLLGLFAGAGYSEGLTGSEGGIVQSAVSVMGNVMDTMGDYGVEFEAIGTIIGGYFGQGFIQSVLDAGDNAIAGLAAKFTGGGPIETDSMTAAKKRLADAQDRKKRAQEAGDKVAAAKAAKDEERNKRLMEKKSTGSAARHNERREEAALRKKAASGDTFATLQLQMKEWAKGIGSVGEQEQQTAGSTDTLTDSMNALTESLGGAGGAGGGGAAGAAKVVKDRMAELVVSFDELHESIRDKIDDSIDIFTAFEKKTDLTGEEIINNMRSQIEGVTEWSENLNKLAFRGVNKALLQELSKLGPAGYEKVNAFVNMTDEQLAEANELYAKRLALPDLAADYITKSFAEAGMWTGEGFITGLDPYVEQSQLKGTEMADAVMNGIITPLDIHSPSEKTKEFGFNTGIGLALGMFASIPRVKEAAKRMSLTVVSTIRNILGTTTLKNDSGNVFNTFNNGITKSIKPMGKVINGFCSSMIKFLGDGLPEKTFYDFGYNIFVKLNEGMTASYKLITENLTANLETLKETFNKSMKTVGEYASEGLSDGIRSKLEKITKSITEVCKTTIEEARGTLREASPSRVFFGIGEYVTIGMANGILSGMGESMNAIDNVSTNVVSRFQNAIAKIEDTVSTEEDFVISPVMDTSRIESGLTRIGTMFDSTSFTIGATVDRIRQTGSAYLRANRAADMVQNKKAEPTTVNYNTTFNQTNNSPKSLTNAEIYRQTNNLISRMQG